MKNPHSKEITIHPDAQKIYENEIKTDEQLRAIFDGLTWLISNNYKIGKVVRSNYRVIKSFENIPAWHKEKFELDKLPSILLLYSVSSNSITIEGITLTYE